ncbi:MAG: hypothetical protein OSA97_20635, partial [Nevskia sp.]|nr:hypothetical protein [Nevskia sp.]
MFILSSSFSESPSPLFSGDRQGALQAKVNSCATEDQPRVNRGTAAAKQAVSQSGRPYQKRYNPIFKKSGYGSGTKGARISRGRMACRLRWPLTTSGAGHCAADVHNNGGDMQSSSTARPAGLPRGASRALVAAL